MPNARLQGIQSALDHDASVRNDVHAVATNWFVNRCPLVTRLPRVPVGSTTFTVVSRGPRPRTGETAAPVGPGDTVIALADAGPFLNGDVLELPTGERVELVDHPDAARNTVAVRRGAEGTYPGAVLHVPAVVRLIGNSRTGAEVDQRAAAGKPEAVEQYCQTWQHPVRVGGGLRAETSCQTPGGTRTPFDAAKQAALQDLIDDMECSTFYGRGEAPHVSGRPKQKGLRALLAGTLTANPGDAREYRPADLVRDAFRPCRANGGDPDVLLVSSEFMTGFATWGQVAHRVDGGASVLGVKIDVFEVPFLKGVTVIEAPLLRPFTAVALTSSGVRMRMKRNEFWSPRGSRGDAHEGDWIAEGAVEVDNPGHHAWVEGITGFAG